MAVKATEVHNKKNEMNLRSLNTATINELNQLNAKLLKEQMMNNEDQVNELKKRIEKIQEDALIANKNFSTTRNQFKPRMANYFKIFKFTEQLNQLNAKLIKAEIINDEEKIVEYKAKIDELNKNIEKESGGEASFNKSRIEKSKQLENLNRLNARLIKAEIIGDHDLIKECKKLIEKSKNNGPTETTLTASTTEIKKENKEISFDFTEAFEELIQANKLKDKEKIDSAKEKINNFEFGFNFKKKEDVSEILKIADESLHETMKLKTQEELEGSNKSLINDLDKRAKAIRKKVIEYTDKLNELIKKESKDDKKSMEFLRVHPEYVDLYGPNRIKNENEITDQIKTKSENDIKTVHVIKKLNENNMTLKQMFVSERNSNADDEDSRFVNAASRLRGEDDEYAGFTSAAKRKKTSNDFRYLAQEEDESCDLCLDKIKKQLLISYDDKVFLVVPDRKPLVENQLIIRSVGHCLSLVSASEDVFQAVNQTKQKLCILCESINRKPIFVEYYFKHLQKWNKHFEIHCFPIKEKYFEESKLWFKKEISDAEGEWMINKKLIFLNNEKSVNKMIPKGMSYFCVTFGLSNDGFAHVIEEKRRFSRHFAQEIIGGLLDLDPQNWLNPELQNYNQQLERSTQLKKLWSRLDVTTN